MTAARNRELLERDAQARRAAARVFDRPLLLAAGAGTGKTTTLVTRIVAWVFGEGWERAEVTLGEGSAPHAVAERALGRVVAITFTEAAAAKMGEEVAKALLDVERSERPSWLPEDVLPEAPDVQRERAHALRGALDHLGVQTIHAWCRRLLVTHPLEAGLHPRLEVDADQSRQAEAVREALEECLAQAYARPGGSDALALAVRGAGPRELEEQLLALLEAGVRSLDLADDPLSAERCEAFRSHAQQQIGAFRDVVGDAFHGATRAKVAVSTVQALDLLHESLAESGWGGEDAVAEFLDVFGECWQKNLMDRVATWGRGTFGKAETAVIEGREQAVSAAARRLSVHLAHLASLDLELLGLARRVLAPLLADVEERMCARGISSFSALLTGARDLLIAHPEVAARVRDGIDQLLVDEFQDTDDRQCDILRAVALSGARESRPGLFLVGDPKQSIYGWRSADLRAFDEFRDAVRDAGGEEQVLARNYRSVPAVLAEVERVIAPVMRAEHGLQPEFQSLLPSDANAQDAGFAQAHFAPVEYWIPVSWDGDAGGPVATKAERSTRIEARALARDLVTLHETGVPWGDVGVLFRTRSDFDVFLAELRAARVPYAVEGDRSYYQRREVIEAAALLRCVLDPHDHLALVTVLRSSVVGVPDAALVPLWLRHFPARLADVVGAATDPLPELGELLDAVAAELPAEVPGIERIRGWQHAARAFCALLARLRASHREEAPDVLVERLRGLSAMEVSESGRALGAWRIANLERFFRELAELLSEGGDVHAVLRRLRRAVTEQEQREEGVPQDLAEDAVQVLTVHGAKGLDFAHVYVMQLHKGRRSAGEKGVDPGRGPHGQLEYRLCGAPTLGWDAVGHERERVEAAERVRTLYVAMTRAERRLVLSGLWPEFQARSRGSAGQLIELVERARAPDDLAGELRRLHEKGGHWGDFEGARWVVPGLTGVEASELSRRRSDAGLPALAAALEGADALEAARGGAQRHAARRYAGSASVLAHEASLGELAERRSDAVLAAAPRGTRADAIARGVGTVIHRVLEDLDLAAEPAAEMQRQRQALAGLVAGEAEAGVAQAVLAEASELLDELEGGQLLLRLRSVAGAGVLRELPVLLPPLADAGPAAVVSGVADLVYLDPDSQRYVVADYKTDRLEDGARAEARTAAYRRQGEIYQRALREAIGLDYLPRFELWYLRHDEIRT